MRTLIILSLLSTIARGASPDCDKFARKSWKDLSYEEALRTGKVGEYDIQLKGKPRSVENGGTLAEIAVCGGVDVILVQNGKIRGGVEAIPEVAMGAQALSFDCSMNGKKAPLVFGRVKFGERQPVFAYRVDGDKLSHVSAKELKAIRCTVPADFSPKFSFKEQEYQVPALAVEPDSPASDCPIANSEPVLLRGAYHKMGYVLRQLAAHPRTLRETVSLSPSLSLEITSRGCSDLVHRFTFTFQKPLPAAKKIETVITELKGLQLAPRSLVDAEKTLRLAMALEWKTSHGKPLGEGTKTAICLNEVRYENNRSECLEDVGVDISEKAVQLSLVDRP